MAAARRARTRRGHRSRHSASLPQAPTHRGESEGGAGGWVTTARRALRAWLSRQTLAFAEIGTLRQHAAVPS